MNKLILLSAIASASMLSSGAFAASTATLKFSETIGSVCSVSSTGGGDGSILFKGESAASETYKEVTFATNTGSTVKVQYTFSAFDVKDKSDTAVANADANAKLWVGTDKTASFSTAKASSTKFDATAGTSYKMLPAVNKSTAEVKARKHSITATIQASCS